MGQRGGFGTRFIGGFQAGQQAKIQRAQEGRAAQQFPLEQEARQGEIDRFLSEKNLKSIAAGVAQAEVITDPDQRNEFLRKHAIEIVKGGGDNRDTVELLNQPFEQQNETLRIARAGLEARGFLKPAAAPGRPFAGVTPTGESAFLNIDPRTGQLVPLQGGAPPPRAGQELIFDPETGRLEIRTGGAVGAGAELQKPTKRKIEEALLSGAQSIDRLARIKRDFDPRFLEFFGEGRGSLATKISAFKEKAGGTLTRDAKQAIKARRKFTQNVNSEFNAYRRIITGAAASVQELESLKKAMLAEDLSPSEFEAAFEAYSEELFRSQRILRRIQREGFAGSLSNKKSPAATEFDDLFTAGADDDTEARGSELAAQGLNPEQILDALEAEGYR